MERTLLARVTHGAHLFGLSTPGSDRDYLSVVLPSADDILLGDVDFMTADGSTGSGVRPNTNEDVDDKQISLARFLRFLEGNVLESIEILNAPDAFHHAEPHPVFRALQQSAGRIANSNIDKIAGFCKAQALTYAPRVDRLRAAEAALRHMASRGLVAGSAARIGPHFPEIVDACASEHVFVTAVDDALGRPVRHLDVCGRKITETVSADTAWSIVDGVVKRYGQRVRKTAQLSADDWKSMSHAIRIAREGAEYVSSGRVTLPVPSAGWLLDVKLGLVHVDDVAAEIERSIEALDASRAASPLPDAAEPGFAASFLRGAHLDVIRAEVPDAGSALISY